MKDVNFVLHNIPYTLPAIDQRALCFACRMILEIFNHRIHALCVCGFFCTNALALNTSEYR